jgi:hypothetical protein
METCENPRFAYDASASVISFRILRVRYAGCDDAVRIGYRLAALDPVDVFHAGRHLAPDRVLAVEPLRIRETDKKLAVTGIRILCPRHRDGATQVFLL